MVSSFIIFKRETLKNKLPQGAKPKWWENLKDISKKIGNGKLIKSYKGHLTTRNNFFYSLKVNISQQIVAAADSVFTKFGKSKGIPKL